jgi:hypothetical protein
MKSNKQLSPVWITPFYEQSEMYILHSREKRLKEWLLVMCVLHSRVIICLL